MVTFSWEKVTITDVQVQERNFPVVHKKDKRFKPAREFPAVETEALGQVRIRDILSTALAGLVPESLEQVLEREEHQRVQVRELLESISGIV